jgi:opacity protein-like surface antigen
VKKIIVAALLVCFSSAYIAAEPLDCMESTWKGRQDAEQAHDGDGWFGKGFAGGFLLGFIGGGGVVVAASMSTPIPDQLPEEAELNRNCYLRGYEKQAQKMNTSKAIYGGLAGMAVEALVILVIVAAASDSY